MPICLTCNAKFPSRVFIEGKQRNLCSRKRCLSCSPFGLHNTTRIGETTRTGAICICLTCRKTYIFDRRKGHTRKSCSSCLISSKKRLIKIKCLEYKGNCCFVCGYDKFPAALDFHHLNE